MMPVPFFQFVKPPSSASYGTTMPNIADVATRDWFICGHSLPIKNVNELQEFLSNAR
jgi:hypothetical protein